MSDDSASRQEEEKSSRGTETRSFGASRRESHDSSRFYGQRLYENIERGEDVEYAEQALPDEVKDAVLCADSRKMDMLPDRSVHLMVTSPPYVAAKDYDQDWTLEEYRELLYDVFAETYRVLVPGGRACINVANIGRSPYLPLHAFIIRDMLDIGFLMRGEIIWDKGASAGGSTAWGSWQSAANPTLRDVHEYILVFSKQQFGRPKEERQDTIAKEDFLEHTKSVWAFQTASAEAAGHPAPFPVELPRRLIDLYSFQGDVILDPFMGSGTTAIAARRLERHYVGLENAEEYARRARQRIQDETSQLSLPV